MPQKRGRPMSELTDDSTLNRQRQLAAARMRDLRDRRRAARGVTAQPTPSQLQQGERIIELGFTDQDAAETLAQLGLRTQGLTLAQDANDARLQQAAVPVDEHEGLYNDEDNVVAGAVQDCTANTASSGVHHQPSTRSDLARFFRTLPARNPFSSTPSRVQSEPTLHTPRARPSNLNSPMPAPSYSPITPGGSEDWRHEGNDQDDDMTEDEEGEEEKGAYEDEQFNGFDDSFESDSGQENRPGSSSNRTDDTREEEDHDQDGGSDDNHEEDSVHNFASEHSAHSDDESESGEISAQDHTLQKLYEQLQEGHHGCSSEQHDDQLRQHRDAVGDDHHGLDDIFNDPTFPSVLALPDLISADRLARQDIPAAAQWRAMFCGVSVPNPAPDPRPMHVCLHAEETREVAPRVAFDVDSFLGFASSLAVARQGLWYQPAPQMRQNVTSDVHLETSVFRGGDGAEQRLRSSPALLRDVPHFLLGRVVGAHDITIHVLFPHLVPAQEKFTSLTHQQLSRWLDQIFHPAVYRYCEADYTQHLPSSFQHAYANSKAHQVEGRQIETNSYQAQQSIGYHLQPEYLAQIWHDILETIEHTPGLGDFREPQLFFSAKGTKLQFKTSPSRPTLLDAMENFRTYFERIIDLDLVFSDRFYVDLGKEICPRVSLLASQVGAVDDEAQVYVWKRCCLEQYIQWMYDGQPPAKHSQGQRYYNQHMLHDAANLTSVTPKRSKLRDGGIIYTQFYGSIKEVSDATKCMPFDNDGLEELALDPRIRQGARHAAGGHRRDARILERAYCASKHRTQHALVGSKKKSFGIREEHRISWALFMRLLNRLRLETAEDLEVVMSDCPPYAWAIKTEVYLNFLWRSADKFATGFEVIRARCRQELVTWEETKMMAMFLRCLRFVFGGHELRRESALWWSRRERPTWVWYGLGFCNTLPRYKYCWLEPRIDWGRLTFKSSITDEVLFGNSALRGQYLRRGGQVRDFFDATRQLELALDWVDRHHGSEVIRDRLISWMVHICLQQFRVDILGSVRSEISVDHQEDALQGTQPFCYEYFEEIMAGAVYLMSGNRCDFKQASHLGHFLFDFDDGRMRTHWEDRPYRKLYQRARTALSLRHGALRLGSMFARRFWRSLYAYHWILPYPCPEVLLQTTKQGQRMWYSIQPGPVRREPLDLMNPTEWEWARKSWQSGRPARLPRYVSWSKEEWEGWIERHVGNVDSA